MSNILYCISEVVLYKFSKILFFSKLTTLTSVKGHKSYCKHLLLEKKSSEKKGLTKLSSNNLRKKKLQANI